MSKSQSRLVTFEVDAAVEQSFRAYCRGRKLEVSRLVSALMFDFVRVRGGDGPSRGANLVRNLEQFETARKWRSNPGRLKRRKRRLALRLSQLVTELEAVFAGLDAGESSPIQEEA